MAVASPVSPAELRRRAIEVEAEVEVARVKLRRAQIVAAEAFIEGKSAPVIEARSELQRLKDVYAGLVLMAARTEHAQLSDEIERREHQFERDAKTLEKLQRAVGEGEPAPSGVGTAWRAAVDEQARRASERRSEYEDAYLESLTEEKAIAALIYQRDALEDHFPEPFTF